MTMRILLIDDHTLFRDGLKALLGKFENKPTVMDAKNLESGIAIAHENKNIDLVLLDLGLPGYAGINSLTTFRQSHENVPVIVLSATFDKATVLEALESGAMGFIPKTASIDVLWNAMQIVLAQGVYVPSSIFQSGAGEPGQSERSGAAVYLSECGLTQRQLEVFKLIIQGKSNKSIANDLGLSESTIKAHVKPILKALNVTSRMEALLEIHRLNISLN